jgi:hypothetical protein
VDDGALVLLGASHSWDVALALLPLSLLQRWRHCCAGIIAAVALAPLGHRCRHGGGVIADVTLAPLGHHCHRGAGIIADVALAPLPLLLSRRWHHHGAGNGSRGAPACAPLTAGVERMRAWCYHCAPRLCDGGGWRRQWCFWHCRAPPARVRRTALVARRLEPWRWHFSPPAGGTLTVVVARTIAWHYPFAPANMTAAWTMALWCC